MVDRQHLDLVGPGSNPRSSWIFVNLQKILAWTSQRVGLLVNLNHPRPPFTAPSNNPVLQIAVKLTHSTLVSFLLYAASLTALSWSGHNYEVERILILLPCLHYSQ